MYLSTRAAIVRNFTTSVVNSAITIILLLIAPLGLAAVIGNTFLVTISSFFVGVFADIVTDWLAISDTKKHNFFYFQNGKNQHFNKKILPIAKKPKDNY